MNVNFTRTATSSRFKKSFYSLILMLFIGGTTQGWAQLSNFQGQYFQDTYLVNPAQAGLLQGLNLNTGFQLLSTNGPGSPTAKYFTADYGFGSKAAIGLIVNSDQTGLISRTRVMATYAYHIHLNETDRLSFGLSLGINNSHFNNDQVVGDQNDPAAARYNARPTYVDGDFGVSYVGKQLCVQAAIPNLRSIFFNKVDANLAPYRSDFFAAISYIIPLSSENNSIWLEPKLAARGYKGEDGVIDMGMQIALLDNRINFSTMYHSDQSMTVGFGLGLKQAGVVFSYTNNMGPFKTYAADTFEIGLKFNLAKRPDVGPKVL